MTVLSDPNPCSYRNESNSPRWIGLDHERQCVLVLPAPHWKLCIVRHTVSDHSYVAANQTRVNINTRVGINDNREMDQALCEQAVQRLQSMRERFGGPTVFTTDALNALIARHTDIDQVYDFMNAAALNVMDESIDDPKLKRIRNRLSVYQLDPETKINTGYFYYDHYVSLLDHISSSASDSTGDEAESKYDSSESEDESSTDSIQLENDRLRSDLRKCQQRNIILMREIKRLRSRPS